jgi:hypothetical protein
MAGEAMAAGEPVRLIERLRAHGQSAPAAAAQTESQP